MLSSQPVKSTRSVAVALWQATTLISRADPNPVAARSNTSLVEVNAAEISQAYRMSTVLFPKRRTRSQLHFLWPNAVDSLEC
jgi:hypothetical protein